MSHILKLFSQLIWTTLSTDTEELIKIQSYIMDIKGKRLQEIDIELEEMLKRMMYLLGKFRIFISEFLDFKILSALSLRNLVLRRSPIYPRRR